MMEASEENLSFLSFFLTEPVYLLPELNPVFSPETKKASDSEFEEKPVKEDLEAEAVQAEAVVEESALQLPVTEGQNRKGVLVLYHKADTEEMSQESLELLAKILKAVDHDLDDVARCNWALLEQQKKTDSNIFESLQLIDCDMIIAFGDLPLSWSMSHFFQKYHITQEASGKELLQADDLSIIAQKRDSKVKLWESLQKLFK